MSKLFETLQKLQKSSQDEELNLPVPLFQSKPVDKRDPWRKQYYPLFSDYNIESLLDYLISLHQNETNTTVGILQVTATAKIPPIVLETFMHLSANCSTETLLADLSSEKSMLQQLNANNAIDQTVSIAGNYHVHSVLDNLFHAFLTPTQPVEKKNLDNDLHRELIKLTASYELSLILLPAVVDFTVNTVQLVRQLNNIVLISEEEQDDDLAKVASFLKRLKISARGVYLID